MTGNNLLQSKNKADEGISSLYKLALHKLAIMESLYDSIDLSEVLKLLCLHLLRIKTINGCFIFLKNESKNCLICESLMFPGNLKDLVNAYKGTKVQLDSDDPNCISFHSSIPVVVNKNNIEQFPDYIRFRLEEWSCKYMLSMAIPHKNPKNNNLGTIFIFGQKDEIDASAISDIETAIGFFSKPIINSLAYQELKNKEEILRSTSNDYETFLNFIDKLSSLTSEEKIHETICRQFIDWLGFDLSSIMMLESYHLVCQSVYVKNNDFDAEKESWWSFMTDNPYHGKSVDGAVGYVFERNKYLYLPDINKIKNLPMSKADSMWIEKFSNCRTCMHIPISSRSKPIGILSLLSFYKTNKITSYQIKLIENLGNFIGTAINNAALYSHVEHQNKEIQKLNAQLGLRVEKLSSMATTDKLTGLFNFAYFKEALPKLLHDKEERASLSLVMADIDHFKLFNDKYGHQTGNKVISIVADTIRKTVRSEKDIVCRYGGEEIVIILSGCNIQTGYKLCERIRTEIENLRIHITDNETANVTISLGCAEHVNEEDEELIEKSDRALYEAKNNGRNQTCCAK
ncbi:MAG: sensor domain-containing diguanylate cyclase [Gammaproteobacteria bacterium]|nr:MAG: sensor domain-containing diguanylate cyclase [Gammaproteobacteria bacterium]